jgi:hypothetical protein
MWFNWDRHIVPDVYDDAHEELRATRQAVSMDDMPPPGWRCRRDRQRGHGPLDAERGEGDIPATVVDLPFLELRRAG